MGGAQRSVGKWSESRMWAVERRADSGKSVRMSMVVRNLMGLEIGWEDAASWWWWRLGADVCTPGRRTRCVRQEEASVRDAVGRRSNAAVGARMERA